MKKILAIIRKSLLIVIVLILSKKCVVNKKNLDFKVPDEKTENVFELEIEFDEKQVKSKRAMKRELKWQKRIEHRKETRKLQKNRRKERRKLLMASGVNNNTNNFRHRECSKIVDSKCKIRVAIDLAFENVCFCLNNKLSNHISFIV